MDNKYWEEKLHGYIDNELGPADRIAIEKKLATSPELAANLKYFQSLKKRLHVHAETIEIPGTVDERLHSLFAKKKNPRRWWVPSAALAIAAAIIIAFFLPQMLAKPYHFVDSVVFGEIVCHDCIVAERAGLAMGELCNDGHRLGLEAEDGSLWRFASDFEGELYIKDLSLVGQKVRIYGQVLAPERLIRVKTLENIIKKQASLNFLHAP